MSAASSGIVWVAAVSFALLVASPGCEKTGDQPQPAQQRSDVASPRTPANSRQAATSEDMATPEDTAMRVTVTSPAFSHNEPIPRKHTGEGKDVSPALAWSGLPETTKELALIMDDPDAPRPEPWVHWVIYKLPPTLSSLPEGVPKQATLTEPAGALQGNNTWPKIGYSGPMPPPGHGVHHYHFKLYALDAALDVQPGLDKKQLLAKMKGHILAEGELIGTYQR
jgi:Raf kinase inhibitor-like YbhB/YbcL family protein